MRNRTIWITVAAIAAVAAVIATVATVATSDEAAAPSSLGGLPQPASPSTAVCGFPGALTGRITADAPRDSEPAAPTSWAITQGGDGQILMIAPTDDGLVVERSRADGGIAIVRYNATGRHLSTQSFDFDRDTSEPSLNNGAHAVAPDGTIYAVDAYEGRRAVAVIGPDGRQRASYPIPESSETASTPHDLHGVTRVADYEGAPALLVGEGERTVHALREDGEYLGTRDYLPDRILAAVGDHDVAGASVAGRTTSLQVASASTGAPTLQVPVPEEDSPSSPVGWNLRGVAPAPDGEGLLVAMPAGVAWIDDFGIRRAFWADGVAGMQLWESGQLVERNGVYWILTRFEGEDRVLRLTRADMTTAFAQPSPLNASTETDLTGLGYGIDVAASADLGAFDTGEDAEVVLTTADGWGRVGDRELSGVAFHYTVTGDPRSATPVVQEDRSASLPIGGGSVRLDLPERRPGAYEVSVSLVDVATGDPIAGACVRYAITPPDAPLTASTLAEGADWGGAAPLRGVQLAARLGVGSHRIQLDFGALVPDPRARPSRDGIDWSALPGRDRTDETGGGNGDTVAGGFANISAAATAAAASGVDLIVQVGQNGDAERTAADSGTWAGWVGVIVAEFARQAPEVRMWSPWNEPNISFDSATQYTELVEIPFADAVHTARPGAVVLGGNTLGLATEWWAEATTQTDVCTKVDAVAVHPYTGWNRSWEEEGFSADGAGFDELRAALDPRCAALPIWDTESGWTGDGGAAFWAQGSNVARKLLWYHHERIAGWTYFFSEGGWGENDLSWSLIQYDSYLKPGALAFAAVSRELEGRDPGELVSTGIPFTYAMRFDDPGPLLAAWSDDMRVDAIVSADADRVTITDQYGARRSIDLVGGRAPVTLTGSPQFFSADGSAVQILPEEEFDTDVLEGRTVTASSTNADTDAAWLTSGTVNPPRPWRSGRLEDGSVDEHPSVEIELASPTTIDRIAVASASAVCCETGLRDYTISVRTPSGEWIAVAEQRDQFWERVALFRFDAVTATAVRVEVPWTTVRGTKVLDVNYTGFAGGLPPTFMGLQTESDLAVGIAAVSAWAAPPG